MFGIEFWNMYERKAQSSMPANNPAEAYHRRIGSVFQCAHPTLWIFLERLINEEGNTHTDILQVKDGQPPKNKKKVKSLRHAYYILFQHLIQILILRLTQLHTILPCNSFVNTYVCSYVIWFDPVSSTNHFRPHPHCFDVL